MDGVLIFLHVLQSSEVGLAFIWLLLWSAGLVATLWMFSFFFFFSLAGIRKSSMRTGPRQSLRNCSTTLLNHSSGEIQKPNFSQSILIPR